MKPQKALYLHQQLEKKNPKLEGKTFMAFEKYDGWYGYLDIGESIMSRQMREIPALKWLSDELRKYAADMPKGRLIFEILVRGTPVFKDLNGILNRKDEQAKGAYLIAHDFIPVAAECAPFYNRHALMCSALGPLPFNLITNAPLLTAHMSYDAEYWQDLAEVVWSEGGEGIILKDANAPYSPGKRNADILKIKLENSEEMLVIGAEQGEGKYEGTLGALLVKDQYNVIHRVSGMSDEERHAWWSNLDTIVGRIVEVKFMCRLANGSIREGRFKAVRYDKNKGELG